MLLRHFRRGDLCASKLLNVRGAGGPKGATSLCWVAYSVTRWCWSVHRLHSMFDFLVCSRCANSGARLSRRRFLRFHSEPLSGCLSDHASSRLRRARGISIRISILLLGLRCDVLLPQGLRDCVYPCDLYHHVSVSLCCVRLRCLRLLLSSTLSHAQVLE